MLPHLPLNGGAAAPSVRVPPPSRFRAPAGRIFDVRLDLIGNHVAAPGNTAAQRAGLRYEDKVHKELKARFGLLYRESPRVYFSDDNGSRYCVPDGVLMCASRPLIIEVKSQHMPEAWWQLRRLYEPVLREALGAAPRLLEICRSYDPQMPFPEQPTLVEDIVDFVSTSRPGAFGVLRWKL